MILADIESREGSTRIEAAVTRGRMALVCAIAGHTMAGGFLVVNAIEEAIYSCHFPEWCKAPGIVYFSILIGPWLVGTYLLTRREALVLFACLFMGLIMGLMWWLGLLALAALWLGPDVRVYQRCTPLGAG